MNEENCSRLRKMIVCFCCNFVYDPVVLLLFQIHDRTKKKAIDYLENIQDSIYRQNPYLLAISTYALALANSDYKYKLKAALLKLGHKDRTESK